MTPSTEYVVLVNGHRGDDEVWRPIGTATAANPKAAIKAVTNGKATERTGTFVAVPARSFQPITRTVQQTERDVWS